MFCVRFASTLLSYMRRGEPDPEEPEERELECTVRPPRPESSKGSCQFHQIIPKSSTSRAVISFAIPSTSAAGNVLCCM